ncbi:MAG: thioredoxin family protein [Gemmatimonadota bacterium]|nr:thioredoxin family protein [Gemmatimonadota bacterium]MDH5805313.1 thioredoxin family protein [Gemmatimonadota bacterium]
MLSEIAVATSLIASVCQATTPTQAAIAPKEIRENVPFDLRELFEGGMSFETFTEAATRRKDQWVAHYENAVVPADILARVEAVEGEWYLLAVAEDWCSDSVNTIPYIARLADDATNLSLSIIRSEEGREIMDSHPTPDGRGATPTVLVLNSEFELVGCFIERPRELQEWALPALDSLEREVFMEQKQSWYDEDAGKSTLAEIAGVMEAAAGGEMVCGTN